MGLIKNIIKKKALFVGILVGCFFVILFLRQFFPTGIEIGFLTQYEKGVTQNSKLWGGYKPEGKYEIINPVFIKKIELHGTTRKVLVPARKGKALGLMIYEAPYSIENYLSEKFKWPQVIGVLDKGTTIVIREIKKEGAMFWGSSISVIAEVLKGEHSGSIVDISDLSLTIDAAKSPFPLKPDPQVLKRKMTDSPIKG